jgi:AraC-like DNA-binding protein
MLAIMKNDTQIGLRQTNKLLKANLLQKLPEPGTIPTAIDGLQLSRRDEIGKRENCIYRPMIAVVVQGSKRAVIGDEEYHYGEGSYMVVGVDMPSVIHMTDASPEKPFLSLSLTLDRYVITQLAAEFPPIKLSDNTPRKRPRTGIAIAELMPEMIDAFLRLVNILDKPAFIPALAPLIVREIHYHALYGAIEKGFSLFTQVDSAGNRIAEVIRWLRQNYREPLRIEALAGRVNMAETTFSRHFRIVTNLSPLQFQKRLRLYEAQRMMLTEDKSVETAAYEVGYESPAQFNREYKRQFGESPHRDINRILEAGLKNDT